MQTMALKMIMIEAPTCSFVLHVVKSSTRLNAPHRWYSTGSFVAKCLRSLYDNVDGSATFLLASFSVPSVCVSEAILRNEAVETRRAQWKPA
jgi:hypothetical protein